jgi:hypothetical protein
LRYAVAMTVLATVGPDSASSVSEIIITLAFSNHILMKLLHSAKAWSLSLLLCVTALLQSAKAVVSNYSFSSSTGTYTAITGTTLWTGTWDDDIATVALPFTFTYDNVNYSSVNISTNGFISFDQIPSVYNVCGLQQSPLRTIAAYGTDLQNASGTSLISYITQGSAPNRQFVVQWKDVDHYIGSGSHLDHWRFQLILNETSNVIQVIWGTNTGTRTMGDNSCSDADTESGSVGLMGISNTDLNIRKITNGSETWPASIAGSLITDVCQMSSANLPTLGLTYTWTPPVPMPMSFVSCTTSFINDGEQVGQGTNNNVVLKVAIMTTGNLTPLNLVDLHLSTTGCTNALADIAAATVYYTGYSNVFSTASQFGSTIASPNGAYTVSGTIALNEGANYFWIAYDITGAAGLGDTVKGCCTMVTGDGTMGPQAPAITCPAGIQTIAQIGAWTPLNDLSLHNNAGVMLVLSDGTIMCKTDAGGSDGIGNTWDLLTPDAQGSYVNGTWTTLPPMHDTRLYFSSQVMQDGRVYVAGGEYGTGTSNSEVFDPLTGFWTMCPTTGHQYVDANSEMLPDGRVLQACEWDDFCFLYNPTTNSYSSAPSTLGTVDESMWIKLPDNSILFVDMGTRNTERYIPSTNTWIADANAPVDLYDPYGFETGGGAMLPDGRAFFIGDLGYTAYYTPSGSTTPGTWTVGPDIPNQQGTPDAAAAMMANGKMLMTVSPVPTSADHFPPPTAFYEFDYTTNTFTHIKTPQGDDAQPFVPTYITNMVDLPDGNILFAEQGDNQYYIYQPGGSQVASGRPTVANIVQTGCNAFMVTGTLFNGISEGASYGDDWQMNTNYPIVRISMGGNVYYARSYNWNRTSVMTGNLADTTYFSLPANLQDSSVYLQVIANGIASDSVPFNFSFCVGVDEIAINDAGGSVYPSPFSSHLTVRTNSVSPSAITLCDYTGKEILRTESLASETMINTEGIAAGLYFLKVDDGSTNSPTGRGVRNYIVVKQQ